MKKFKICIPYMAVMLVMGTNTDLLVKTQKSVASNLKYKISRSIANEENTDKILGDIKNHAEKLQKQSAELSKQITDIKENAKGIKELRNIKRKKIKQIQQDNAYIEKIHNIKKQELTEAQSSDLKTYEKQIQDVVKKIKGLEEIILNKIGLIQDKLNAQNIAVRCQNKNKLDDIKKKLEKLLAANEKVEKEKKEKREKEKKKKEKIEKIKNYAKNMYLLRAHLQSLFGGFNQTYKRELQYVEYSGVTYSDPFSNIAAQPANFSWIEVLAHQNGQALANNSAIENTQATLNIAFNNNIKIPSFSRSEITTADDLASKDSK